MASGQPYEPQHEPPQQQQQHHQYPYNPYNPQQEAPENGNHKTPQPVAAEYGSWNGVSSQQPLPQWYNPPSNQAYEGIERAHSWVADQQQPYNLSPPPTAKTPFSEYGSTLGGATAGSYPFPSSSTVPLASTPQKPGDRVCGVKRNVFFIVLALGAFVLVVGIATGLGVGLALGKTSTKTAAAPAETSTSATPTPSTTQMTTTLATNTQVSPTPAFTGTVTLGPVTCPGDNSTVYISQITSKPFDVECGRDYNSKDGATDLSHQATNSFTDCINVCGSKSSCVGVGWGVYQNIPTCWLKSALGEPNDSPSWYFAKLQSVDQTNTTIDSRRWTDG